MKIARDGNTLHLSDFSGVEADAIAAVMGGDGTDFAVAIVTQTPIGGGPSVVTGLDLEWITP